MVSDAELKVDHHLLFLQVRSRVPCLDTLRDLAAVVSFVHGHYPSSSSLITSAVPSSDTWITVMPDGPVCDGSMPTRIMDTGISSVIASADGGSHASRASMTLMESARRIVRSYAAFTAPHAVPGTGSYVSFSLTASWNASDHCSSRVRKARWRRWCSTVRSWNLRRSPRQGTCALCLAMVIVLSGRRPGAVCPRPDYVIDRRSRPGYPAPG